MAIIWLGLMVTYNKFWEYIMVQCDSIQRLKIKDHFAIVFIFCSKGTSSQTAKGPLSFF